jgi:hypothetical protein
MKVDHAQFRDFFYLVHFHFWVSLGVLELLYDLGMFYGVY